MVWRFQPPELKNSMLPMMNNFKHILFRNTDFMSPDCQDGLKRYQQDHQAVTRYKRAWPTPHENFIIASYRRNAMARPVIPITVAKMVPGKCWSLLKDKLFWLLFRHVELFEDKFSSYG